MGSYPMNYNYSSYYPTQQTAAYNPYQAYSSYYPQQYGNYGYGQQQQQYGGYPQQGQYGYPQQQDNYYSQQPPAPAPEPEAAPPSAKSLQDLLGGAGMQDLLQPQAPPQPPAKKAASGGLMGTIGKAALWVLAALGAWSGVSKLFGKKDQAVQGGPLESTNFKHKDGSPLYEAYPKGAEHVPGNETGYVTATNEFLPKGDADVVPYGEDDLVDPEAAEAAEGAEAEHKH